jgi:DNA modification methylase
VPPRSHTPRRWRIIHDDCLKTLPKLQADSVDAIVTDPPYGLNFMGKDWDRPMAGNAWHEAWAREALRVLKPGAHLLAFGGTRTFHRLTCALEDAGFEIRDCLCWLYGQGFPKSLDVGKAIDKAAGAKREVIGTYHGATNIARQADTGKFARYEPGARFDPEDRRVEATRPATAKAREWDGWGTALKPAWEPIIVARKPLNGTVAENVLKHRTGALNIDGCRIGFRGHADERSSKTKNRHADFRSKARENRVYGRDGRARCNYDAPGRWPANVALSHTDDCRQVGHTSVRSAGHHPARRHAGGLGTAGHKGQERLPERSSTGEIVGCWECSPACPVRILDEQSGDVGNRWKHNYGERYTTEDRQYAGGCFGGGGFRGGSTYADAGGASRFFYCAKASRSERDAGLTKHEVHSGARSARRGESSTRGRQRRRQAACNDDSAAACNTHPTVKPIELMRWLVRLVTPPGGAVLDPFAGSGSTGAAAVIEGARFVGIEREAEYIPIIRARIKHWARQPGDGGTRKAG